MEVVRVRHTLRLEQVGAHLVEVDPFGVPSMGHPQCSRVTEAFAPGKDHERDGTMRSDRRRPSCQEDRRAPRR